jgi:hypothetical protein
VSSLPLKRNDPSAPKPTLAWSAGNSSYEDGRCLEKNPSWHAEESPFKARQIVRMLKQQGLQPAQSKCCRSHLATLADSSPFVQPTSYSSFLTCGGRCSWMDIR